MLKINIDRDVVADCVIEAIKNDLHRKNGVFYDSINYALYQINEDSDARCAKQTLVDLFLDYITS